jgi:FkbM family methyltransferase
LNITQLLRFIIEHPLNRDQPIQALFRFIRWQIRSRCTSRPIVHEWIEPAKFYASRGEVGVTANIYAGLHELEEMAFLLHLLTSDDLFVDVGSNVGSFTVLASAVRKARSVAIEPIPETFKRLEANLALNQLESIVEALNIGVGESENSLLFTANEDSMNHVCSEETDSLNTVSVPVQALDSLLAERNPTLLKIDVEGFETPVIQGAQQVLQTPSLLAIIIELIGMGERYGFDESTVTTNLEEHGFKRFQYDPFTRSLHPPASNNEIASNQIFIRDSDQVEKRLKESPPIQIHGKNL